MTNCLTRYTFSLTFVAACMLQIVAAQNLVTIDASEPAVAPVPVTAKLGSSRAPNGDVLEVNSEYLTMNGKPWLPVMGEFHFSRYPESRWEQEIMKMKAAGVNIISTYIIWIHHEQTEGVFDWSGQRDLRRFVQLCARHGMYVYPRLGPWAHAEARNGGLPDWVLKKSLVRQDDPVYLSEVDGYYAQIAQQLEGLLWKDGGPVIGIQIENEYHDTGPGKGDEHIRTLKSMALRHGLDVPLYTVTGWDGAAIPLDAVLPVFGGYAAAPWDGAYAKLPPSEVYAFRFANRSAGSMGAIGDNGQNSASSYRGTPFLTAEVGSGIQDTYFRRPVVSADDIAAIAPVMLGSGVNLLGYYMFHGGRNPEGGPITLQESQRTGYATDVPVKSYDFQAPLGEFGQERESLRKLKLVHYFLNDFGSLLAPMKVREPAAVPANPGDTSIPRVSVRTRENSGFIFFNNYVRGLDMPARAGFQVKLRLPGGEVSIPESPIVLPSGAFGIWPVGSDLEGTTLRYSTAQLFKRVQVNGDTYFFFFAINKVRPEWMLEPGTKVSGITGAVRRAVTAAGVRLRATGTAQAEVRLPHGVHLILLPESLAEQVWRVDDPSLLLVTGADAFSDQSAWTLQSEDNEISFEVFGQKAAPTALEAAVRSNGQDGLFQRYDVHLPAVSLRPNVTEVRAPSSRPPLHMGPPTAWRSRLIPLAPDDKDFDGASQWKLTLPQVPDSPAVSNVLLRIRYQGDVARLSSGDRLLDDNFWNGLPWEVGLRELGGDWHTDWQHLQLSVLPMPAKCPIYVDMSGELHFSAGQASAVNSVLLVPQYQVVLQAPPMQ